MTTGFDQEDVLTRACVRAFFTKLGEQVFRMFPVSCWAGAEDVIHYYRKDDFFRAFCEWHRNPGNKEMRALLASYYGGTRNARRFLVDGKLPGGSIAALMKDVMPHLQEIEKTSLDDEVSEPEAVETEAEED